MATYLPPTENLPIFDDSVFTDANTEYLSYNDAKKYFLTYPQAQGTENLLDINVAGTSTFSGNVINSTSGTAYFQLDKVRYTGYVNLTASTSTLTLAQSNHKIYCSNATSNTLTLPDISAVNGITYFIISKVSTIINVNSTQNLLPNNVSTITIGANENIQIASQGGNWYIFGKYVASGGGGGDVYLANSQTFTGVNTFSNTTLLSKIKYTGYLSTSSATVNLDDTYSGYIIRYTGTSGTINLPLSSSVSSVIYTILKYNTGSVTISTVSGELIAPPNATFITLSQNQSITLYSTGNGWVSFNNNSYGDNTYTGINAFKNNLTILDGSSNEINSALPTATAIKANMNCSSITLAKSSVNLGTAGTSYNLTMGDSGKMLTSTGNTGTVTYILPKMADITATGNYCNGLIYYFYNSGVINTNLCVQIQAGETAKILPNGTVAPNSIFVLFGCSCQIRTNGTDWFCVGGNNNSLPLLSSAYMGLNNATTNVGGTLLFTAGNKIQLSPSLGNAWCQIDNALVYPYQILFSTASATTALTEVHSGKWLVISASNNTFTLPTLNSTTRGYKYQFYTSAGNSATINTAVGQPIYYNDNSTSGSYNNITSLSLPAYTSLILECQELSTGNYSWRYSDGYRMSSATTDITGGLTTGYVLSYGATYGQGTAMSNRWIITNVTASGQYFTLTNLTTTNKVGLKHKFYNNSGFVVEIRTASASNKLYYQNNEITTTSAGVPVIYLQPYTSIELENQELSSNVFSYRITGGDWYINQTTVSLTNNYTINSKGTNNFIGGANCFTNATAGSNYNTIIGNQACNGATQFANTVAIGALALNAFNSTGTHTVIGTLGLKSLLTGDNNSSVGLRCGQNMTSGSRNNFVGGDNAGALITNCDENSLFGNQNITTNIQRITTYSQPSGAVTNSSTFTLSYNPINVPVSSASLFIAGMKMFCYGGGSSFSVTVISYTSSTKTVVVSSPVYIEALEFIYFYPVGEIAYQNTVVTGGTATTTITIQTSLTISSSWTFGYIDSGVYKYVGISSYVSGTGVLTLSSAITTASSSSYIIWNSTPLKNDSIKGNVAIGYFALSNSSGQIQRNTAIGNYSMNGSANVPGGYDNATYLYGLDNTALGYASGASCTGMASNNTFIGSGADIQTVGLPINNSTAIGYNSKVLNSNTIMLGTSNETVYFPNQMNIRSVYSPYATYTLNSTTLAIVDPTYSDPIRGTYIIAEPTNNFTITLPTITSAMYGIEIVFRKNQGLTVVVSIDPAGTDAIFPINSVTATTSATTLIASGSVSARVKCMYAGYWAII